MIPKSDIDVQNHEKILRLISNLLLVGTRANRGPNVPRFTGFSPRGTEK